MSPQIPGAYVDAPHLDESAQVDVPGVQRGHPHPGGEVAGPALTDLVITMRRAAEGMEQLFRQARMEAMFRFQRGVAQGQTDANGDALLHLFEVPQGATGYLTMVTLELAGADPANPVTGANPWHAIYAAQGTRSSRLADIIQVGGLVDFLLTDATAGQAKLPDVYKYGDKNSAPSLVGPNSFWAVIRLFTAARQVTARWQVLVEQPEP